MKWDNNNTTQDLELSSLEAQDTPEPQLQTSTIWAQNQLHTSMLLELMLSQIIELKLWLTPLTKHVTIPSCNQSKDKWCNQLTTTSKDKLSEKSTERELEFIPLNIKNFSLLS